jgi:hypothetical protein
MRQRADRDGCDLFEIVRPECLYLVQAPDGDIGELPRAVRTKFT